MSSGAIERILKKGGWKKKSDFTPEDIRRIGEQLSVIQSPGFILCPFGFKVEKERESSHVDILPKGGLRPHCPVHGDNCPGLRKIL